MNAPATGKWSDTLYTAWAIAQKDILEGLKNWAILANILTVLGIVLFFHFMLTLRPFDKDVDVLVYDPGDQVAAVFSAAPAELSDGYRLRFLRADSPEQLDGGLGYRHLGLAIPADFAQTLAAGGVPVLTGTINWVDRARAAELAAQYTRQLSELLGRPVRVVIDATVTPPRYPGHGNEATAAVHLLVATLYMAITVVPFLMLEEKRARTLEVLQVSPAGSGQVVLGKALAGVCFVALSTVLALALNYAYVVDWALALVAAACTVTFSTLLALALGTFLQSPPRMSIWGLVLMLVLSVAAFFAHEPNLVEGARVVLGLIPSAALAALYRYACSAGTPPADILTNLGIALAWTAVLFGLIVWQVRRMDR